MQQQQGDASPPIGAGTGGPSNYVLRLKKQKQKKEPFERSCSPLLAAEDQIEVKKCESSTGSKFIIKGSRSNASMNSGLTTPPPTQCNNALPTTIEDESEPAEI